MAKKKPSTRKPSRKTAKTRKRRTPEEIIADLQKKIREVKQRAAAKQLKKSPAIRDAVSAVRAIDKALETSAAEEDSHLRHALADARKPLAGYLAELGVSLPKALLPLGRRPRPKASSD